MFKGIKEFAYRVAMKDIRSWSGEGAKRFNTEAPLTDKGKLDIRKLQAKISDIEKFLESPTSTYKGVVKIYQKRADSLNKQFFGEGEKGFTWQEWSNFWDKVGSDYFDRNFDYRAVSKLLYQEKKYNIKGDEAKERIDELQREGDIDKVEARQLERLSDLGLSYSDLK